ncbi:NLR family CARD domain-containing protein 3-like [Montipora capricornis]|uniref:NLR family CARD domain-containing protein 3-like n=1 Tax=Montipora capricornis TaxID=246305 RepID=UPI0035F1504C
MASGPALLASSKETMNYARLCRLLVDVGTQALRDTFDAIHPPATLHKILSGAHPTLQSLRTKGILNPTQWGKLYPTAPSSVSSASFDITLLMVLLRNICSFSPPASTGSWDKLPPSYDNSTEANIARIKYYRNGVYGHASQASIDDVTFNMLWHDISNTLLALGSGTIYANAISRLKTECMDPDFEEHYRELLKQWKKDDDNTKETLEELKEMLKQLKSDEDSTKHKLGQVEAMSGRSLQNNENRVGPKTDPCGTPNSFGGIGEKPGPTTKCSSNDALRPDALTDGKMAPGKRHADAVVGVATLTDVTGVDGSEKVERKGEMLTTWNREEGDTKDRLGEMEDILKRLETDEGSSKDTPKEAHKMSRHLKDKLNEMEDAYGPAADFIDVIRQLYKSREGWLAPLPWCEGFRFHLDSIFTRLKMVSRKKEQGVKTDSIVNMLEIFKPNKECPQPKRVLIEGEPGIGKTTYCNKVAYDWAENCKAQESFPDVKVLLLLKCRDITSDLWEAIDDQLLPEDIKKEEREKFFTFIRDHQSKVLLILDGLDELPTHKLPVYEEIIRGRMLSKCYLIVTARHKAGIKVRECCDTLLEVKGFTKYDAEGFISRYFKTKEHLATKLLERLHSDASLREVTANPLNAALLCLLCEDFQGDLPKGRTLLYVEIVQCVLRRYRKKKELPKTDEDLTQLYHAELKHLGCIALNGLLNDEMYFNDSAFQNGTGNLIPELGFLSAQPGRSKRRPSCYYGFLHKSFQEFFAAFYLSCQLVNEIISPDSLLAERRYFKEFEQVLMFTCGILAQQSEAKAMALMASIASQINQLIEGTKSDNYLCTALNCIKECENEQGTFRKELARSLGLVLEIQCISCRQEMGDSGAAILAHAMATNSTLTKLYLSGNGIGDTGAAALAKAVEINSTLTELYLSGNRIGDTGAAALAKAVEINSMLATLGLPGNGIGESGAAALAKAVEINSTLTELNLCDNRIGDLGVAALAKAQEISSTLTELYLFDNGISDTGAVALAKAVEINSTLKRLELCGNVTGDSGAAALAKAVEMNSTLTHLHLSGNGIGELGAAALAKAVETNSTLATLGLSGNAIGDSGAAALAKAVEINSTLRVLHLSGNGIGDSGATALAKAVEINSTLATLGLSGNGIDDSGAAALAKAVEINSKLIFLNLFGNRIGDLGAAALDKAMEISSTLTELYLSGNGIGDTGAAALAKAVEINSTLTTLGLSDNRIGDSGAAALAKAVEINSTLKYLGLAGNGIGDSGAAALAKAWKSIQR